MTSSPRAPSRGRSRTRSATPTAAIRSHSASPSGVPRSKTSSPSRSHPRSISSRTPPARNGNRDGGRTGSRSLTRSRSPSSDGGDRRYRERSYSRSRSRDRGPGPSSKIVIEKLTKNVTEAHIREIFGSYGEIDSLDLPMNKQCEQIRRLFSTEYQILTVGSHDKPRDSIYPLRSPLCLRVGDCSHA